MPFFVAYLLTVLAANLAVTYIAPSPWFGFGLTAPAGVAFVGLALVLRDFVHKRFGIPGSLLAIALGSAISLLLASPALVVASVVAFAVSELLDLAVFVPVRARYGLVAGVLFSGLVGSIVDSALFLHLAFGSLAFFWGQLVGKLVMTALAGAFIAWHTARKAR